MKFSREEISRLRLIACDLDGTLLLNGAQRLQPETPDLIRRLVDKGIIFAAASGRQYSSLRRLFAPIRDQIAYLCENGCISYYQDRIIHQYTMDTELAREMIRDILASEGIEALVSGKDVSYLQPKKESYVVHMRDNVRNNVQVVEDLEDIPEPYMKISFYRETGLTEEDFRFWEDKYSGRSHVVTGGRDWMDMMPTGVNKATGLGPLLEHLGVKPEECMAIGDNYNDTEMLELAGMPVAMESGKPEILDLCRDHTDTVEHYLQHLLEMLDSNN